MDAFCSSIYTYIYAMFLLLTLSAFGFKSLSLQTAHRDDKCMQVFRADMAFILLRHKFSKVKAQKNSSLLWLCCWLRLQKRLQLLCQYWCRSVLVGTYFLFTLSLSLVIYHQNCCLFKEILEGNLELQFCF